MNEKFNRVFGIDYNLASEDIVNGLVNIIFTNLFRPMLTIKMYQLDLAQILTLNKINFKTCWLVYW